VKESFENKCVIPGGIRGACSFFLRTKNQRTVPNHIFYNITGFKTFTGKGVVQHALVNNADYFDANLCEGDLVR